MTNMQRIEAVAWIGEALGLTYGRTAALMTRQEQRTAYRLFVQKKNKRKPTYPTLQEFLHGLEQKLLCGQQGERENESY